MIKIISAVFVFTVLIGLFVAMGKLMIEEYLVWADEEERRKDGKW